MDDTKLLELAELLEAESTEGRSQLTQYKPPHVILTANRAGMLSFAAACLRAAAAPIAEDDCRSRAVSVQPDHWQFVSEEKKEEEKEFLLVALQRMETWPEPNL